MGRMNHAARVGRAFIASGLVQGVGFRWFVRDTAAAHAVHGWVRNASDGTVQGEVHGDGPSVAAFLRAVGEGPQGAHVADLQVREIEATMGSTSFEIRR